MTVSVYMLPFICMFAAVSCKAILNDYITLDVSINNNETDSEHNITAEDVESIINKTGQEYLEQLLINTHIGYELDFDLIDESIQHRLIVQFHISLSGDIMTGDTNMKDINIYDLQSEIQSNSDKEYGQNVIHINVKNEQTLHPIITTEQNFIHSIMDHSEHMSVLLVLVLLVTVTLFTFCVGCIVILCYLRRIRNEQKRKINSNSSIADSDIEQESDSEKRVINIVIEGGGEHGKICVNNVNESIVNGENTDYMSDSEQLYRNNRANIPGMVIDESTKGNDCTTPYQTVGK